jgi:diguanylate cyclase (GGDEF)-like protein
MQQINQRHGRAEGDVALTNLGRLMIQTFRASDVIARLGDDEFVVLMTDTSEDKAQHALGRLDAALADYNRGSGRDYQLSYSAGTLQYQPEVHPSVTGLLGAADMAMYERQRQKRKQQA